MLTLRCEYCINPIGVDVDKPMFSWEYPAGEKNVYQESYRIIVRAGNTVYWDSGEVKSPANINVEYAGMPLGNLCRYDCSVTAVCRGGAEFNTSDTFFVTGLIDATDISGKWIEHPSQHDNPVFYNDFYVKKGLSEAYVLISGLGYYELKVNDIRAHDTYNVPAWTDYCERDLNGLLYPYDAKSSYRFMYNVYDIGDLMKQGINRYSVMLGNGFFNQVERLVEGDMSYGTPRLLLEIHLKYENGSTEVITSGEDTLCTDGPLEFNNIYFGEQRNDNIGMDFTGCTTAFECIWESGTPAAQFYAYDRITEIIEPVALKNGTYDAGRCLSGRARIKADAPRGAVFSIEYYDDIDEDGSPLYRSSGGEWQIQENKYTFGTEGTVDYAETFGWRGFRYFTIKKDDDVNISEVTVEVICTDMADKSSFKCADETINWIHEAYVNSQTSNMHGGVPSDCPHRERLGYTGDGQVTAESMLDALGAYCFLKKWNDDILLSQNTETGYVPHTVPFSGGGGGPAWGSACAIVPAALYDRLFDRRIVRESYSVIQGWVAFLERENPEYIIEREIEGSWCLGDWCVPTEGYDVEKVDLRQIFRELDPKLVNTCYFYRCVQICIDFGNILSRETTHYKRLAERIRGKFNTTYLNEATGVYSTGRHYANVYPLYFDMVPEGLRDKVIDALIEEMAGMGYRMDCGIFASSMIFEVLANADRSDVIKKILAVREYPSFGYMMDSGATTLWETWDGRASLNHPMFGGMISSLYKYFAGIRYYDKNGMLLIEPLLPDFITDLKVEKYTVFGRIGVKWERMNGIISAEVSIPGNMKCAFKYRDKSVILGNGIKRLSVNENDGTIRVMD